MTSVQTRQRLTKGGYKLKAIILGSKLTNLTDQAFITSNLICKNLINLAPNNLVWLRMHLP